MLENVAIDDFVLGLLRVQDGRRRFDACNCKVLRHRKLRIIICLLNMQISSLLFLLHGLRSLSFTHNLTLNGQLEQFHELLSLILLRFERVVERVVL